MGEEFDSVTGTVERTESVPAESLQELKRDVAALQADLKKLMSMMGTTGKTKLDDAKTRLWETAQNLEDKTEDQVRGLFESVREHGAKAVDLGREHLENRPVATLLWSFGAGYVLGKLMGRR